jgi:hypothetical protein
MIFFSNREQEGTTGAIWGLIPVGGRRIKRKGVGGLIW